MNTRRVIAIFEHTIKEHTQQRVRQMLGQNIINPQDYVEEEYDDDDEGLIENSQWYDLHDILFDTEWHAGRNIFPTPDLIIRCLNFIRETELSEFGRVVSFQDPSDTYNIEHIFRHTAFLLVGFEIFDRFKNWVIECFPVQKELDRQ